MRARLTPPAPLHRCRCGLAALALLACAGGAAAAPTTFGTVIGNAILCRDQIENKYFYSYMKTMFGPAYKHEGGAFWFKTETKDAMLWGTKIIDVIVSDDTSPLVFVGAVADATPEQVEKSVLKVSGLRYRKKDLTRFPIRESDPGGQIVYFDRKSKVFCAKFKPLPPKAP